MSASVVELKPVSINIDSTINPGYEFQLKFLPPHLKRSSRYFFID
jgi:hypothetical protein